MRDLGMGNDELDRAGEAMRNAERSLEQGDPENATEAALGSTDGLALFQSIADTLATA